MKAYEDHLKDLHKELKDFINLKTQVMWLSFDDSLSQVYCPEVKIPLEELDEEKKVMEGKLTASKD